MIILNPSLVQFIADESEKALFKLWCRQNDVTMSQQLRRLMRQHLVDTACVSSQVLDISDNFDLFEPIHSSD